MPKFRIFVIAMDQQALLDSIKRVSNRITGEDLTLLAGCAAARALKKGEILLREGEVCRSFYLVEKGYLRTYCNTKDGAVINLNFTFEGDFTCNLQSLKGRKPSEFFIEAGEDGLIWVFDLNSITEQVKQMPAISQFVRRLAIQILLASEDHSKLFKMYTPTERYRYIEKNSPRLLQRIPLSQLSSYLGVARETLSRIRAKSG